MIDINTLARETVGDFLTGGSGWAIVNAAGGKALAFDVFISMDASNEAPTVSNPVEMGSFATYNKITQPMRLNVTVAVKGTNSYLQSSLALINDLAQSTETVSVISPEREFENMNLTKVQYSRSAQAGIDIIYFELEFTEVRQVEAQYSNAKLAPKKSRGMQQRKVSALEGFKEWVLG